MPDRPVILPDFALYLLAGPGSEELARHFPSLTPLNAGDPTIEKRLARRCAALVTGGALDKAGRSAITANARAHYAQSFALTTSSVDFHGEGFRAIFDLPADTDRGVVRVPLPADRRSDRGPFDIIGDVHGCDDELSELLRKLGYRTDGSHVEGRRVIFAGDLTDRGPASAAVLARVAGMVQTGLALCVMGNHDFRLLQRLRRPTAPMLHGLAGTMAQIDAAPGLSAQSETFLSGVPSHLWLDGGRLVVAHAGLPAQMHGRDTDQVRDTAAGFKGDPMAGYQGEAMVVRGHFPVRESTWSDKVLNLDTGCVYGGDLTALRWPERETVSVAAARSYAQPSKAIRP